MQNKEKQIKKLKKPMKKELTNVKLYISDESGSNQGCQKNCYKCD